VTRIDFYVLDGVSDEPRLRLACRLAEKAAKREHRVYINCETAAEAAQLDELLWTFSQSSFLPHRIVGPGDDADDKEPDLEPVSIGVGRPPSNASDDLMINLASAVPEFFSRYQRVAELIDGNENRREDGRKRYRFYRDRGYEMATHRL
jgi:DNA polymerase III subunit chi